MAATEITASQVIMGVKITISARFPVVGLTPAFEYDPVGSQDFYNPDFQSLVAGAVVQSLQQAVPLVESAHLAFGLTSIEKMKKEMAKV